MTPINQERKIASVKVNKYLKVSLDIDKDGYSDEVIDIIPGRKYDFEYVYPKNLSSVKTIRNALVTNILNTSSAENAVIECIPNTKNNARPPKERRLSFPLSNLRAVRYSDGNNSFSREAMIMILDHTSDKLRFIITKLQFIEDSSLDRNYTSSPFKEIELEIGREYEFTYLNRDGLISRVDGILNKIEKTDRLPVRDCIIREASDDYTASSDNDYSSEDEEAEDSKKLSKDYDLTISIEISTNYDDSSSDDDEDDTESEVRYTERIVMLSCIRDCKPIEELNPLTLPPKPVIVDMQTLVDIMADSIMENISKFTVDVDDDGDATLSFNS